MWSCELLQICRLLPNVRNVLSIEALRKARVKKFALWHPYFVLNPVQMILVAEAFSVDLLNVVSSGRPCSKPAHFGLDLDPAEGLAIARRRHSRRATASPASSFRAHLFKGVFLVRRRRHVDPLIKGTPNSEAASKPMIIPSLSVVQTEPSR